MENIGIDNLIQKFAEQKGTGKERPGRVIRQDKSLGKKKKKRIKRMHELNVCVGRVPRLPAALAGFEEYMTALAPEGGKKSRAKAFRIPGLGKRDKEPDST